jgi:hypothetical protein
VVEKSPCVGRQPGITHRLDYASRFCFLCRTRYPFPQMTNCRNDGPNHDRLTGKPGHRCCRRDRRGIQIRLPAGQREPSERSPNGGRIGGPIERSACAVQGHPRSMAGMSTCIGPVSGGALPLSHIPMTKSCRSNGVTSSSSRPDRGRQSCHVTSPLRLRVSGNLPPCDHPLGSQGSTHGPASRVQHARHESRYWGLGTIPARLAPWRVPGRGPCLPRVLPRQNMHLGQAAGRCHSRRDDTYDGRDNPP